MPRLNRRCTRTPVRTGKWKCSRVRFQVVRHFILGGKVVARRGERHAVEAAELRRREEPQRVPALAPGIADARVGFQNEEARAGAREVIAGGQSRLAAADHDHVECGMQARRRVSCIDAVPSSMKYVASRGVMARSGQVASRGAAYAAAAHATSGKSPMPARNRMGTAYTSLCS